MRFTLVSPFEITVHFDILDVGRSFALKKVIHLRSTRQSGRGRERYSFVMVQPDGRALEAVLGAMARGQVRAMINATLPLESVAEAHERLAKGHHNLHANNFPYLCVGCDVTARSQASPAGRLFFRT